MGGADSVLLQYGALGVMTLVSLLVGRELFRRVMASLQRETDRADRNEEALRALEQSVREQVIPASIAMVDTAKQLIDLLAQEKARRRHD